MYFAHSTKDVRRTDWQPLTEHLVETAALAERFGNKTGLAAAARLAGLLHDLGKFNPAFLDRLAGARTRVDHSTAGAAVVLQLAKGDDKIIAELIAYGIAGHHAGLPDKQGSLAASLEERLSKFSATTLDPAWRLEITPDATGLLPNFKWRFEDQSRFAFQLSFLGRMIFSCLVDADFKNTEAFYARVEGRELDRDWPSLQAVLPGLVAAFDAHMDEMRDTTTEVNRLRADILHHVRSRAGDPSGLFTLTVPTGGGKTLASLGFALDHAKSHAKTHRHERIIYAIPFAGARIETCTRRRATHR